MRFYRWRGQEPRLVSLTGRTDSPGAEVYALDSTSGWAALADREGEFTLAGITWYPGETVNLVLCSASVEDDRVGTLVGFTLPSSVPEGRTFQIGEVRPASGRPVDLSGLPGLNAISREPYDVKNRQFYRDLVDRLTAGEQSTAARIDAISQHVADHLNYDQTQWELGSPRRVLETGSEYCGHLSEAMATLLETAGIRNRIIHMSDGLEPLHTHAVVEVLYDGAWRLYDPTFGATFPKANGTLANYRDLSLDPGLITEDRFSRFQPKFRRQLISWMLGVYRSRIHQYFIYGNGS